MRRVLAIVLMLFLPLQWSWSVAASLCEHEVEASHFGHHAHVHDGAEASASVDGGVGVDPVESPGHPDQGATNAGYHADCHTCHLSIACIGALGSDRHLWPADAPTAVPADPLPEPPVESLYRPPLDRPALIG